MENRCGKVAGPAGRAIPRRRIFGLHSEVRYEVAWLLARLRYLAQLTPVVGD